MFIAHIMHTAGWRHASGIVQNALLQKLTVFVRLGTSTMQTLAALHTDCSQF